jgi:dihydroorotase
MTVNPARILGLDAGVIAQGTGADIVLFDPDEVWVPERESFRSKSRNSAFTGKPLRGRVKYTIVRGEIIYKDEK